MKSEDIYPIKFEPILKETIWGGKKLSKLLQKESDSNTIGESWELSGVKENISVVANGKFKGKDLTALIDSYKESLVGEAVFEQFGNTFPLLFKFIDANDDLSIQLHPNDALAKERHHSFGKTEMWYVVNADEGAKLYVGFDQEYTKESYVKKFQKGEILEMINEMEVHAGDTFFIETGTVHAIGKGVLVAEIQQTSDVTYRIFDWNRTDAQGNSRELHTGLALDAFDFTKTKLCTITYDTTKTNGAEKLVNCPYFKTSKLALNKNWTLDLSQKKSFVVYMCVSGKGEIVLNGNTTAIRFGETVLIPAAATEMTINTSNIELLEVCI